MRSRKISSIPPDKIIKKRKEELLKRNYIIYFLKKLLVIVLVLVVIFKCIYGITFVEGQSMYPSIEDGDLIIYYRINSYYDIGDVISLKKDGKEYISRIVACGGDIVDITEDGELLVNGNVQQEEVFFLTYKIDSNIKFPYKLDENSVFVLSDYRTSSIDSRTFGQVSFDEINGKVITIFRRRGI